MSLVAVASAVAATGLALVVLPGLSLDFWLHRVHQGNRVGATASLANQSLRGVIARIGPPHPQVLWLVAGLLLAALMMALAVRMWCAGHELASLATIG